MSNNSLNDTQKFHKEITNKIRHIWYNKLNDIFNDLYDEINELKLEIDKNDKNRIYEEIGDVLFVLCNLANNLNINLNNALNHSTEIAKNRFFYVENSFNDKIENIDVATFLKLWKEAKRKEKKIL